MPKSAAARWPLSKHTCVPMSELALAIERYLGELSRQNASAHTIRNYASDLEQFLEYFSPPGDRPPAPGSIDAPLLREWLTSLYDRKLDPISVRRKLAAVRSFFQFLLREKSVPTNVARLLRTPKAPKRVPLVPTAEQTNTLVDGVGQDQFERPHPERDVALFELLYGCGLRISELVGLDIDDFDLRERWIRVRGKGRKERQVPYAEKASVALEKYLGQRSAKTGERGLLVNHHGGRLSDRGAREIVKFYARMISGDASLHPHSLRHAYATHLLADGADLRAIQELLGHARLATTQKYTQVSLTDLMTVYDKAHPKARQDGKKNNDRFTQGAT
jgi:integrase/recombinase XerC